MRRVTGIAKVDNAPYLIGSDEVGYGPMAGPLLVVAVSAPAGWDDPAVTDSKDLGDAERKALYDRYWNDDQFTIEPVLVSVEALDRMKVGNALLWAHAEAVKRCAAKLGSKPLVAIDGNLNISHMVGLETFDVVTVVKGDLRVPEIGLASCIAKTMRDSLMRKADKAFPGYGFANHKGYDTVEHEAALEKLGPCALHRTSYSPVARAIAAQDKANQPQEAWAAFDDED